ncbi:HIT domain-containing protein [Candidatus Pacearchaeota archaeon]|nr:HIT domain-containing protein [Candidatus Pacearchaeota archaeon]
MTLTPEEVKELKAQLSQQIQHLPPDQKVKAQVQIDSMSPEAIESMLNQQKSQAGKSGSPQKSPYRMMIDKDFETVVIEENSEAIAVLEINPVSEGHTLIVPKKAVESPDKLPAEAFTLAQKVAKLLKDNLKAKSTEMPVEEKFGEAVIDILPVYDSPVSLNSPRKKSSLDDLKSLVKKIKPEEKPKPIKIKKESNPELPLIRRSRRIP